MGSPAERWRGCPRSALTPRIDAWIELHDRTEGKLDFRSAARIPMLLVDVFRTIEYAQGLRLREEQENREREWQRRGAR